MDLLGSILKSMDKPPALGDKQKQMMKKQKEAMEKQKAKEKEYFDKFRKQIEERTNRFIQDPQIQKKKFEPMPKVQRSIVHDVADIAGLTAFSFGEDEVDRYVMVFKKEFAPSDDELLAYRRGEEWDAEKAKEVQRLKELAKQAEEEEENRAKNTKFAPYKDKYEKLVGKELAKDAAQVITSNRQFGFVPSENKRDLRSIEQTMADIKAKKKMKLNPEADASTSQDTEST